MDGILLLAYEHISTKAFNIIRFFGGAVPLAPPFVTTMMSSTPSCPRSAECMAEIWYF
jgi:hypothetical protein